MKVNLLYLDRDFDPQQPLPWNESDLIQDLELNVLFNSMAQGDKFLFDVARRVILTSETDLEIIRYRQQVLQDCLNNPEIIRELYQIPLQAIENKRKRWLGIFTHYPAGVLSSGLEMMAMFVELLLRLRRMADEHSSRFTSPGFRNFFAIIQRELNDEFFGVVEDHIKALRFREGVLISAELGRGNEGIHYTLRKPNPRNGSWLEEIFRARPPEYSFSLHPRDEQGARALGEIKDRAINQVANAVAQSAEHIDHYLAMLRGELAFYIGCLNLFEQVRELGHTLTFPEPYPLGERRHTVRGLYDISLALTMKKKVVGNDVNGDGKDLVIITGANQGGKSTFLRSIGQAQIMMQCGMFVAADHFAANLCSGIFTHYKRQEDSSMKSGKLDEELGRMSAIADHIRPQGLMLFNESFAATNEREGSEIARQITQALLDRQIKVFFVTHQFTFADGFYQKGLENALFLRAERKSGGGRTYKLFEGQPLQTSFGEDVYRAVFEDHPQPLSK